ncbi:MAG: 4Fe-4S dicluster domain-containing protein [Calditrichaeota bacterium]|nr:MAG: 4Fe-4S dicluster domain-containing protein [Calditrichota bacterium]
MNQENSQTPLNLKKIKEKLNSHNGKKYWRSLEELLETEEFKQYLHNEFPYLKELWDKPIARRNFLKYMGASLAFAGLAACTRQPLEHIVPYVRQPEEIVPGKPLFFATAHLHRGYALGILVESHMGRPTKIEGNPQHPASLGATDAFAQASILSLYDPDRSKTIRYKGRIATLDNFVNSLNTELATQNFKKGAGLRILTETITSPTIAQQIQDILAKFPQAKWHQYEAVSRDSAREGARLAFGEYVETRYQVDRANVIVALDSDFLTELPGSLRYARQFASRRRADINREHMNRLYAVESTPTITGSVADHRFPLKASEIQIFAYALAKKLGLNVAVETPVHVPEKIQHIAEVIAKDLQQNRGAGLIIPGEYQSPEVHYLAHVMNDALGNAGRTVFYTAPVEAYPLNQGHSLQELVKDMASGAVDMLIILDGNPVYTAPVDFNFAQSLQKVKFSVHLSYYYDETSRYCTWHIPVCHPLESWSDARTYDGTVTILQPLIEPLFGGKTAHELLAILNGQFGKSPHDIVMDYWKKVKKGADFDKFWKISLHDGLVAGTELPVKRVRIRAGVQLKLKAFPSDDIEIIFRPDPTIWDGRFANNGWLQELPKPLTKLTWDNVVLVAPATAERLGVNSRDVVEITYQERKLRAPVWVMPGHPENSITLHLGYGRTRTGKVGRGIGYNAYLLRTSQSPWFDHGVQIKKTGKRYSLATTQHHHSMDFRHLVREASLEEFKQHPNFAHEMGHEPAEDMTLYPGFKYEGYAWGMTVDLNSCIGCGACIVACQSENNIPVVGKKEVSKGREMHWIRLDRYYEGDVENPRTYHQPVLCMHCENAPCEVVCPVGATLHDKEGLNVMVYNRCVGTRYCSNNCPYKVRRFNFYRYADYETPILKLMRNPDVTVRHRGVMEKCTYCLQRISWARIEAKRQDREIQDGEIVTACEQVCPTQAITFGNINDSESRVAKLKANPLNYHLLADLNTRPRTSYLARVRNPNPELEES